MRIDSAVIFESILINDKDNYKDYLIDADWVSGDFWIDTINCKD